MTSHRIAIVPGSFDPITYGHISIVERAVQEYDKVYLAVMINASKQYRFTLEQRKRIAEAALADFPTVEVIASEGMLWKLAEDLDACAIVKGYRNETDYHYEMEMAAFNERHNPKAKTVLYPAADGLEALSSTLVRQEMQEGTEWSKYLPPKAAEVIQRFL